MKLSMPGEISITPKTALARTTLDVMFATRVIQVTSNAPYAIDVEGGAYVQIEVRSVGVVVQNFHSFLYLKVGQPVLECPNIRSVHCTRLRKITNGDIT